MAIMKARPILILTVAAAAVPAVAQIEPSALSAVARTTATTRIDQPATIATSQDLVFAVPAALAVAPTVTSTRVTAAQGTATTAPTTSTTAAQAASTATAPTASSVVRNATSSLVAPVPAAAQASFTVSGDSGQAISVIVPSTVEMASSAGVETALLTTTNNLVDGPQFLGGTFASGGTLSFAVGGQVTLASSTTMSSGTYNGLLAVVAQYN